MQKKVLTEQALYYGDVAMPKDWDIDRDKLSGDILQSVIQNKDFPFSRTFDMLNTYMSCLLYTSPSPRDRQKSRMPSSA